MPAPKYHGDISKTAEPFYQTDDGNKLVVALILLFFLGGVGAHRFYLDMTTSGFLQLCMFFFGMCCLFTFAWGLAVWVFGLLGLWLVFDFVLIIGMYR